MGQHLYDREVRLQSPQSRHLASKGCPKTAGKIWITVAITACQYLYVEKENVEKSLLGTYYVPRLVLGSLDIFLFTILSTNRHGCHSHQIVNFLRTVWNTRGVQNMLVDQINQPMFMVEECQY